MPFLVYLNQYNSALMFLDHLYHTGRLEEDDYKKEYLTAFSGKVKVINQIRDILSNKNKIPKRKGILG